MINIFNNSKNNVMNNFEVIDISQESNFQNNNTKNQISVDEKLLLMGRMLPRKALYGDRILPKPSSQNRKDYERKESPKEELDNRLNEVNNNYEFFLKTFMFCL